MMDLGRREQVIILIVVAVILFSAGYQFANREKKEVELVGPSSAEATHEETGTIMVHVDGAVEKPGVYKLPSGSRVNDAIEQAVALPDADLSALNLAEPLKDGRKLTVFRKTEQQAPGQGAAAQTMPVPPPGNAAGSGSQAVSPAKSNGLVNINTAGAAELDTLPGIGPALAERILQHRQANGPFQTIEEIKNVSGIGDKKYADLQHRITVH